MKTKILKRISFVKLITIWIFWWYKIKGEFDGMGEMWWGGMGLGRVVIKLKWFKCCPFACIFHEVKSIRVGTFLWFWVLRGWVDSYVYPRFHKGRFTIQYLKTKYSKIPKRPFFLYLTCDAVVMSGIYRSWKERATTTWYIAEERIMTDSEVLWLLCDFVWMADVWVVNYSMILKRLIFDPVFNQYISIYVHI